jgi:hypothetical protein
MGLNIHIIILESIEVVSAVESSSAFYKQFENVETWQGKIGIP